MRLGPYRVRVRWQNVRSAFGSLAAVLAVTAATAVTVALLYGVGYAAMWVVAESAIATPPPPESFIDAVFERTSLGLGVAFVAAVGAILIRDTLRALFDVERVADD